MLTVLPSLLLSAMAPLRGQHYPVSDVLVHSGILLVGGCSLFGLTMLLRTLVNDVAAFSAAAALVALGVLFTFVAKDLTPYSLFRVMNGADYFFRRQIPWTGMALSLGVGAALTAASIRIVERRDF